ncbi:hypothetical protein [uncultured Cytophaga sp.]|uniref:hypothetical protein n=1 Tax=uncultured Cytophaga sp. TaxID=160238 RepID=UPI0026143731|nr:hypothetical protein [uncultured Cytophaga sp.]
MKLSVLTICFIHLFQFTSFAQKENTAAIFMHHMNEILDTTDVSLIRTYSLKKVLGNSSEKTFLEDHIQFILKTAIDSAYISKKEEKELRKQYTILLKPFDWSSVNEWNKNVSIIDSISFTKESKPICQYISHPITSKDSRVWLTLTSRNWSNISTFTSINIYELKDKKMKCIYHETISIKDSWIDSIGW